MVKKKLKAALSKVRSNNAIYFGLFWYGDRVVARAKTTLSPHVPAQHVILCPPGNGNIGDQAMFESFLENVDGEISALVTSKSAFIVPEQDRERVTLVELGGVTGKEPVLRWGVMRQLRTILQTAKSFTVVGADIMDGRYNVRSSIGRFSALHLAASMGIPAYALGFSWSETPERNALRALRKLSDSVTLNLRDPRSLQRIIRDGAKNTRAVSDIVFTSESRQVPHEMASLKDSPGSYIVVNASGLIDSVTLTEDYRALFEWAHAEGLKVVMLPHVIRAGANDLPVSQQIFEKYGSSEDVLIERILSPAEVRGSVAGAKVVVTGRMHLAIMSLSAGVPAFTLATVGKVEGLYEMFQLPKLVLQPEPGFSAAVLDSITDLDEIRGVLRSNLVEVRGLALRNMSGY